MTPSPEKTALVSVIIPCYKQAHFLPDAIESALGQTYPRVEVIVVDDGSPDETAVVAARYPAVKYVRQSNQGLSLARNTGFRHSSGEYVVFLDSDDRLHADAVAVNLDILAARPDCAFVSGHYRFINADGSVLDEWDAEIPENEPYVHLLTRNYIGNPATVMFRRETVRIIGGFRPWPAGEDYDAYLRVTRVFPVCCHGRLIVDYRRHGKAMSDDPIRMLVGTLQVLRAQRGYVRGNPAYRDAYRRGIQSWRDYYLNPTIEHVRRALNTAGERRKALRAVTTIMWSTPAEAILLLRALARGDVRWQSAGSDVITE